MNKVICPFCKNSDNLEEKDLYHTYICKAHKNETYIFDPLYFQRLSVKIFYHDKRDYIYLLKDKTIQFHGNILSLDPNLTPENIDQKIKKYLIFQ
jgi:hypothetical protein